MASKIKVVCYDDSTPPKNWRVEFHSDNRVKLLSPEFMPKEEAIRLAAELRSELEPELSENPSALDLVLQEGCEACQDIASVRAEARKELEQLRGNLASQDRTIKDLKEVIEGGKSLEEQLGLRASTVIEAANKLWEEIKGVRGVRGFECRELVIVLYVDGLPHALQGELGEIYDGFKLEFAVDPWKGMVWDEH